MNSFFGEKKRLPLLEGGRARLRQLGTLNMPSQMVGGLPMLLQVHQWVVAQYSLFTLLDVALPAQPRTASGAVILHQTRIGRSPETEGV